MPFVPDTVEELGGKARYLTRPVWESRGRRFKSFRPDGRSGGVSSLREHRPLLCLSCDDVGARDLEAIELWITF